MRQIIDIIRLSFRDYGHEWRMSGCFVLALASVLAPMLILFGLKFGIVTSMVDDLIKNPVNREIRPVGSGRYDDQWLESYRARNEVQFIIPKTRALAATIQLNSQSSGRIVSAEMLATGPEDPLFENERDFPDSYHEVILSHSAADKLGVGTGDEINASLARQFQGERDRVHLPLRVLSVAGADVTPRDIAYVNLSLLVASEDFKDGRAVPELDWDGNQHGLAERSYPSFRLYARSIYDVEGLVTELENQRVRVKANVAEIATVQSIDRNLAVIFWIIACVSAVGFSFSLGASLWANVDRKRKELCVLRLVGFHSSSIVLFPVLQSFFTAALGWILAVFVYLIAEQLINAVLAPSLNLSRRLCFLLMEHFLWALILTVVIAIYSASLGGLRAARIEPSDGLRDI